MERHNACDPVQPMHGVVHACKHRHFDDITGGGPNSACYPTLCECMCAPIRARVCVCLCAVFVGAVFVPDEPDHTCAFITATDALRATLSGHPMTVVGYRR